MKFTAFALLALLAFAAVAFARQDEALDTMALEDVEPVPRLLAEVLSTRVRAAGYGEAMDGAYGDREIMPEAPTIPTTQIPAASPTSSATATSAGVLSFFAAVMALAMF